MITTNGTVPDAAAPPTDLYLLDEPGWLMMMTEVIENRRWDEIDRENLIEFLTSMARSQHREVASRLTLVLTHWLKWQYQPLFRSRSWRTTVEAQHEEVVDLLKSRTLRNHVAGQFAAVYAKAVRRAGIETGFDLDTFPAACPFTLDWLLSVQVPELLGEEPPY